ncbi:MAG TPA: ion transporter [Geminicoccaceae bacterium]|nr:ion transporter [Geminicoccaceae bacterium]
MRSSVQGTPGERRLRFGGRRLARFRAGLRRLYYGRGRAGRLFQAGLLALDIAAVGYFLLTTFVHDAAWVTAVDVGLGLLLTAEFLGRLMAHRHPMRYLDNFSALIDVVVILSLLSAAIVENLAFLRLLRTLRLLRSYQVLGRLKRRSPALRRNAEIVAAGLNLAVFIVMVSALVQVSQQGVNPEIRNFLDALYFSVTALTTTGYGDVLLVGSGGRLLSIAIMIGGISLFLRLIQAVFRASGKVRFSCPRCGLRRHDPDALHCKACGVRISIPLASPRDA